MSRFQPPGVFRFLFLVLFITSLPALAVEKILHFDSEITLAADGAITVIETIDVWAEGEAIKRGIYRDFPTRYRDELAIERRTGFEVMSVFLDGEPTSLSQQNMLNGIRVYMGDKNHYLSHGQHRFQLTYHTDGQLQFFDGYDELYWNVSGNGWLFPINKITTTVHLPSGGGELIKDQKAWTGYQGQQGDAFKIEPILSKQPDVVRFSTTQILAEHQGLTIGLAFKKGLFTPPDIQIGEFIRHNILWLTTALSLTCLLVFMGLAWFRHGRDPQKGIIVARFKPPAGLSPAAINYLDNKKITNTTLTAVLLSLAVKGAIRIKQKSQQYQLFKKTTHKTLSKGEKLVYKHLFVKNNKQIIIDKTPNKQLSVAKQLLATKLQMEYRQACFKNNKRYIVWGWLVSAVCCLLFYVLYYANEVNIGELANLFMVLVVLFILALTFLITWPVIVGIIFGLLILASLTEILQWFVDAQVGLYFTLVMIGLNMLFTWLMQSPTIYGRKIKDKIDGLKLYMTMAEEQRLNLMNPPEKNLAHYEALLPYAVALGLENRWAEKFSQVFALEQQEKDSTEMEWPLTWYQGDTVSGHSLSHQLSKITSRLDNTVKSAADVPASKQSIASSADGYGSYSSSYGSSPSTSSSSGFSSGGGYSGGGGGGGGGGGW